MIEDFTTKPLFSTPLARMRVAGAEALNAALLAEGARMRAASEGVQKSNRGGWHSEGNLFDSEAEPVVTLRAAAMAAIERMTAKVAPRFDMDGYTVKLFGWMNANPPGGFNAPHTHPGAHWSGVYYVNQPEVEVGSSGMIEFLDPRSDLPDWRILKARAFKSKFKTRPQAGEIIVFPSYLTHWVYPNECDEERVTVAFNATFKRRKG